MNNRDQITMRKFNVVHNETYNRYSMYNTHPAKSMTIFFILYLPLDILNFWTIIIYCLLSNLLFRLLEFYTFWSPNFF